MATPATAEPMSVGQPAPDFTLQSNIGHAIRLSAFRENQNVLLYFMRSFTCAHCTYYVRQLVKHYAEIKTHNTEVLVVGIGETREAQGLARRLSIPFPVLNDPEGVVYEQFTLNRVLLSLLQQSAAFVIDQAGMIRFSHRATNPFEWLQIATLNNTLAALKSSG